VLPPAARILIDATGARTGGGVTYLVNLLPRLTALDPERRFRVLLESAELRESIAPAANLELELRPPAGLLARMRFSQLGGAAATASAWGADLYFSAADLVPLRAPCPTIASFRNPNVFTSLDQGWYAYQVFRLGALRRFARITARSCARVLFVSHDSARWIGDALGLPERKRAVIHHGIDPARFAAPGPAPLSRPYVLSLSSIYRYKNFVRLIEAWTQLARGDPALPDLAIVGDDLDPDYSRKMREARRASGALAERIHLVGGVPYRDVPAWYAGAALFAFPSYLETFGHPLLEAMASGVPVVAGDIPVSREVAGDAARYADPHDTQALAQALAEVLRDAALRRTLVERGRARVLRFGWEDCARRHLALFDEAVAQPGARRSG
jgi:glycosyltransferase involved in cell wall biosynthesis